jgi:phosphopantothenoylcysteine decarboxylase/phosphopantothenate--cysteine ligase
VLVAPATANVMAKLTHGLADDLLSTLCLATTAPLLLAPAMNGRMWDHPSTQANVDVLRRRGADLLGPADGEQACGETGPGRMLEPEEIVRRVLAHTAIHQLLNTIPVLVTAGPTREPLDPVRYIGNRSSGRMGYALAAAFAGLGARVCLISGPVKLDPPPGVERVSVETALEMEAAVMQRVGDCRIFAATAAVADYRAADPEPVKIKKSAAELNIRLVRNPDILAAVAALPNAPFTLGFAAETHQVEEYATEKMHRKGLDMIAANRVGADRGGFDSEENALTVLWPGSRRALPMTDKIALARQLALLVAERYTALRGPV